jgi:hypothetical protein
MLHARVGLIRALGFFFLSKKLCVKGYRMRWTSTSEMIKDLNLQLDSSDEIAIKSEIRKELSQIHPDKNNGQFNSDSDKERFNKLTLALDFLEEEKKESQALISTNQPTAIVQAITNSLAPTTEERLNRKRDECRSIHKAAVKSRYFFPRLGSGVFAAFCGLLITFAEQLKTQSTFQSNPNYRSWI